MKTSRRHLIRAALCIIAVYLAMPVIAGALKWGQRTGPVIYPRSYHEVIYHIGYSLAGRGKPRLSFVESSLCRRPYFYGCEPRLISKEEFEALLKRLQENGYQARGKLLVERYSILKKRYANSAN